MNGERLFRILGLVDEDLIEEAASPVPRRWRAIGRAAAAAACAVLVCGAGLAWLVTGGFRGYGSSAPGESGSGIAHESEPLGSEGTAFMSYAGPVFPLATTEEAPGLTAERTITWDFAPGAYEDGSLRQWGAAVTDRYVLTNSTDSSLAVTALYPFAGSFRELASQLPTVTVDGAAAAPTLYAGGYAGGFRDAGLGDGSTWNLEYPDSWTDYRALLEDGSYLERALGNDPSLDIPVTVYEFTDSQAPAGHDAATQAITFTIDQEKATVLTYGFNGSSWDTETGWRQYSYFVPNGQRRDTDPKLLAVLGEDIGTYTLGGYENGACEAELDGVSCTVTRRETTLDAVLDLLCRAYLETQADWQWGMTGEETAAVPYALFRRAAAELLVQYGVLAESDTVDRYANGRLDDILSEAMSQQRVLYLAVPVTIPAGNTLELTFTLWKEPSFDYGCSGSENVGLQGYDLVTRLGSTLDFTAQTAALVHTEAIELVRDNFGFDLASGVTEAKLDPEAEHYYLEIRPIASD